MTLNRFIGVDVGTGSVRAAVFDRVGVLHATSKRDISLFHNGPDIAEQSSDDIWRAVCTSVREAVSTAGCRPEEIGGLGFDATCSLVVVGTGGAPVAVGAHGDPNRNIIVWMDHRAAGQASRINATKHRVLDYVGGVISPEMETPKLLWLKENLPDTFASAWQFFDLADYLTWRATGSLARSVCTVTCKWTYMAHEQRWDESYFREIGLGDLADEDFRRIGTEIVPAGFALGSGLTDDAAIDLGLSPGTFVGAGLIDAHAGGIGSLGGTGSVMNRMAYVFGTSACTMASSSEPIFIPGVWGPYFAAMVPGLWLNEGGQSSAGAAIDQLIAMHPASAEAEAAAVAREISVPDMLAERVASDHSSLSTAADEAGGIVVVPDFLGNRSPFADPNARAVTAGLGMERDLSSLVSLYVAGILGVGYGLRQIIDASRANGATIDAVTASGGAGRLPLVCQLLADCAGVPVAAAPQSNPVLRGAAMLGAIACGAYPDIEAAMEAMSAAGETYYPATGAIAERHDRRFNAFEALQTAARMVRDSHSPVE